MSEECCTQLTLQEQLLIIYIKIVYDTEFNDSNVSRSVPLCEILISSKWLAPYISLYVKRQHLFFTLPYMPVSAFVPS